MNIHPTHSDADVLKIHQILQNIINDPDKHKYQYLSISKIKQPNLFTNPSLVIKTLQNIGFILVTHNWSKPKLKFDCLSIPTDKIFDQNKSIKNDLIQLAKTARYVN